MKKYWIFPFLLLIFAACGGEEAPALPPEEGCPYCLIQTAEIVGDYVSIPYVGDIWTTTWAADGNVYAAFGDATGMTKCLPTLLLDEPDEFDTEYTEVSPGLYTVPDQNNEYCEVFGCAEPLPLCQYTPAGLLSLTGDPPNFELCDGRDQCVVSRHIPYGNYDVFANSDKPSSILAVNERIYMPMHYPPGDVEVGTIAYSDDNGRSWAQIPNSPWHNDSPFQVLMFFNMGQNYSLNRDGYVYGLGIVDELPNDSRRQQVYLARVPLPDGSGDDPVLDYAAYEYFTGLDESGAPLWSGEMGTAVPLDGLETIAQGAAFYHEGAGQYLFLSGFREKDGTGALFAAPEPWGPWYKVNDLPAGYIAGVIAKGATADSFYFTAAGGGPVTYNLNVGQIRLRMAEHP